MVHYKVIIVLVELKLEQWIKAGLNDYRQSPLLIEQVFYDDSLVGFPTGLAPQILEDETKRWIPNEFAGGTVRYGETIFPVLGNSRQQLDITGDPSQVSDVNGVGFQIIPPAVAKLTELLQTQTITVLTSFPQIPTQLPAVTIRLNQDSQADTYLGESLDSYILYGAEVDANRAQLTGQYLISLWSDNRLATLWMYAWLANYTLRSIQDFASWGLYDVAIGGSDLDPALQFLPERTYVRHLSLTATRAERAISTQDVEYVTGLYLEVIAHYARIEATIPYPMGV